MLDTEEEELENDLTDFEEQSESEDFYFESDHLALRGNSDYTKALQTLSVLYCKQIEATRHYEILEKSKQEALENPEEFLKKLKNSTISFPGRIDIPEVPKINFEKYANINFKNIPNNENDKQKPSIENSPTDKKKKSYNSDTMGKSWTSEEQRRLEELLNEYPPEQFEMRRFAKISKALGNRTTKQVASRVQKFFKKLQSAGLPIPGRIPKSSRYFVPKTHRYNKLTFKPSTFFPAHDVPVKMTDDDDYDSNVKTDNFGFIDEKTFSINKTTEIDSDNEQKIINNNLSNEEKILKLLKRIRNDKQLPTQSCGIPHYNYQCFSCQQDPIYGTRWHCENCTHESINFCSDCLVSNIISNNPHSLSHKFIKFKIKDNESIKCDLSSDEIEYN